MENGELERRQNQIMISIYRKYFEGKAILFRLRNIITILEQFSFSTLINRKL